MVVTHNNQQYKVTKQSSDEWRLTSVEKPREYVALSTRQMCIAGFSHIVESDGEMGKAYEEYFQALAEGEEALSFAEFRGVM